MLKIIILSCVTITVFLNFQEVKGFNLIPSIIHGEPSINFPLEESSYIQHLQNIASKFGIETILNGYLNKIQNANAVCTKLYDKGRETVIQLSSILSSCLRERNETLSADANIEQLPNLTSEVRNRMKDVYDTLQCFQDPLNLISCLNRNLNKLNINGLVDVISGHYIPETLQRRSIYTFNVIPNVIRCYENLSHQFNLQYFCELLADMGHCIQGVIQILV